MPFKSKAQQRFMFAVHPRIAKRWAKEMKKNHKSIKSLPQRKRPRKRRRSTRRRKR